MVIVYLLLILFFSFLLIKATEILVQALNSLAKTTRLGKFAITSFVLALATSLPELFVGVSAALEKEPNLALGNVLGSNIANLSLVIGGAAIIGGTLRISGNFLKEEVFYTFLAGALPLLLLIDNQLSRVEGLLLLMIYGVYNYSILWGKPVKKDLSTGESVKKLLKRLNHRDSPKQMAWVFLGAALLLFSADMLVKIATALAHDIKMPVLMIGLFLVAIGTSLPELSFEAAAVKKKQVEMALGDLMGSVVANSTLVLGLTALIQPIYLEKGLSSYLLATIFFAVIFCFFWLFVKTKSKLERWEGVALVLVYLIFAGISFLKL